MLLNRDAQQSCADVPSFITETTARIVRRDGRRRRDPSTTITLKSLLALATSSSRSSRAALEAVRSDSNLSGGAVKRRELLPRALVLSLEHRAATSLRPAIGNDGVVSLVGSHARTVLPHFQFLTKAAGREATPGAPRLAATRTVCLPAARNTYTRTERRRVPCVLRAGVCMRARPYLRIRDVYGHRQHDTLERRLGDAPRPGRIRARDRDASHSYRDDRARRFENLEINRRRRRRRFRGAESASTCARARFSFSLSPIRPLFPLPYPLAVKPASKRTKNGAARYHCSTIER